MYLAKVDADDFSITAHWLYLTIPTGENQSMIVSVHGYDFNGDLIVGSSGTRSEPLAHGIALRDRQIVIVTSHDPQISEIVARKQFIVRDPKIELNRFVYWWADEYVQEPQKRVHRRAKEAAN